MRGNLKKLAGGRCWTGSLQKKVREWRGKLKNLAGASGKRPKAALSRYRNAGSTEVTSGATRLTSSLEGFSAGAGFYFSDLVDFF